MKFPSALLSLMACGLVVAAPLENGLTTRSRQKIVTFYSQIDFRGSSYTLFDNRLGSCVDFTRGPISVQSATVFHNTVCSLYTDQGCETSSFALVVDDDTPNTPPIEMMSMYCTTAVA